MTSSDFTYELHRGDLPAGVTFGDSVAVDTETMGLLPARDRLCLVQLSAGDGTAHLVKLAAGDYAAPNLRAVLADPKVTKIFHFARFDLAVLRHYLGVRVAPVYCTKVASKLVRTNSDRHGLKDLCRDLLGVDLSKEQQTSDWGADEVNEAQCRYAAQDVLYLHRLRAVLDARLAREGRGDLARACFDFLPARAEMDLAGWGEDLLTHH
ncbi:MAG: ribonuclease D [Hyphomicrobiales bacterium]|nr:ribonuclease D [Hyphomicrobiales bacterium]MCP5370344.1 ribonuclease D [Hyphomicrobiales bacterium]